MSSTQKPRRPTQCTFLNLALAMKQFITITQTIHFRNSEHFNAVVHFCQAKGQILIIASRIKVIISSYRCPSQDCGVGGFWGVGVRFLTALRVRIFLCNSNSG